MSEPTDAVHAYLAARPRLHRIAYGVLRDSGEAEQVVQDVWLRWQDTDHATIDCPAAFLATVTRRLALSQAASARRRREFSDGDLPDVADVAEPTAAVERKERMAALVWMLLARLTPVECAVYLLREGFGYPHERIAALLHTRPVNTRQTLARARRRLAAGRRSPVEVNVHRRLSGAVIAAACHGDLARLELAATSLMRPSSMVEDGAA